MKLWRISRFVDLDGEGGTLLPGRWHFKGSRIVYAAERPALALLEFLANIPVDGPRPADTHLFSLDIPDDVAISSLDAPLPEDWRSRFGLTRKLGRAWLEGGATLAMKVPSALTPGAFNYLINPRHPDAAQIAIGRPMAPRIDERLHVRRVDTGAPHIEKSNR